MRPFFAGSKDYNLMVFTRLSLPPPCTKVPPPAVPDVLPVMVMLVMVAVPALPIVPAVLHCPKAVLLHGDISRRLAHRVELELLFLFFPFFFCH